MNIELVLWAVGLVVLLWLMLRYHQVSQQYTQTRQAYQALQAKHSALQRTLHVRGQRLDVLLSTISEVVLRVDHLGRVLGGNEQAKQLFQFDQVPRLPQAMLIFYRDTDWLTYYQQAVKSLPEQCLLPEMEIRERIFLPRLVALGDKEALLLCMDVTAQMQLQQKQKLLFENLMHDLKTPLTSLLGYARSIESFADDPVLQQEAASVIAQEATYINALMNSMLTLNHIEHHKHTDIVYCDVLLLCQQVWQSLQQQMQDKGVILQMDMLHEPVWVAMQEDDCHRILMNVASNALRFSPDGSTIVCSVTCLGEVVDVMINDCGCGIADQYIRRVTERFYRVDHVRNRDKAGEGGHGLGLAIVKETLERDGGSLTLSNHELGGLSVVLHIPKGFKK